MVGKVCNEEHALNSNFNRMRNRENEELYFFFIFQELFPVPFHVRTAQVQIVN